MGIVGIRLSDIGELTIEEAINIKQMYEEEQLEQYKLLEKVIYNAVGYAFNGSKFNSIFTDTKANVKESREDMLLKGKELSILFEGR